MPNDLPTLPRRRIIAIDTLRGLTFFVMLFVNCLSGASGIPYGIQHFAADVDGMSLADVVFPAFLFVVGTSIPFSLNQRLAVQASTSRTVSQIATRAFGLIVIGLFMVNTEEGFNETAMGMSIQAWALCFYGAAWLVWGTRSHRALRWLGAAAIAVLALVYRGGPDGQAWMQTSWWGILGCIGWAYLVSSIVYLAGRGRLAVLALAVAGCIVWFMFSQAADGNAVIAMHATHTSIVLCGAVCVMLFFDGARGADGTPRLVAGVTLALVLAALAWLLHHLYPISKIGATPPWALYSAALCSGLFVLLYWLIEMRGATRWTAPVQPAAANPLVTYLLPVVLATAMQYLHLHWWPALMHGGAAILFSLLFSAAVVAVVALLNTYNVKLKL
jgi:heparan-alpha-glucosaminide N-acetyltransferase